jgi:hypothetical protein
VVLFNFCSIDLLFITNLFCFLEIGETLRQQREEQEAPATQVQDEEPEESGH